MDLGVRRRLRTLLDHFAVLEDDRESWRVAHPLPEVLLLVVCSTIGACDDFDEIVEWGEENLPFLRRFLPYHHGIPGSRWLRILLNRIDPALFSDMFQSWAAAIRPDALALVAIDGKTSRASHDRGAAQAILDAEADYLPAVKASQCGLMSEIERFFDDPRTGDVATTSGLDKGHGRVEERAVSVSSCVDWLDGGRRFPGEHCLPRLALGV